MASKVGLGEGHFSSAERGFLTKNAGGYGVYVRRNFHPADTYESFYLAEFEQRYGMHLSHLPAP